MTRMSDAQEKERGETEDALAALTACDLPLRLVETRIRQAIQRTGLERLLAPSFEELEQVRINISVARGAFSAQWQTRTSQNWSDKP